MAPPRRTIAWSTAPSPSSKSSRSSDSPHPVTHSAAPIRGNASNILAHSSSGRSSRPACFFTGTSRPPVARTRPLALAHSATVVIARSSSLLLVRNTRSPILGSITSPVPSNPTSSRASARVIRPVWVSLRPAPIHAVNAWSRRSGSAFAAAAASDSSDDVRIATSLSAALHFLPGGQDPVDTGPHSRTRFRAGRAGHQQLVVAGVLMPHRGDYRQRDGLLVQCAPGRRAPDPAAAPHCGMPRDRLGQLGLQRHVLVGAPLLVPLAAPAACVLVGQALRLSLLKGRLLHQDPLALVALAGAAKANHHGRRPACLLGAPAQRGVAGGQVLRSRDDPAFEPGPLGVGDGLVRHGTKG